jgi:hypothetical protein
MTRRTRSILVLGAGPPNGYSSQKEDRVHLRALGFFGAWTGPGGFSILSNELYSAMGGAYRGSR